MYFLLDCQPWTLKEIARQVILESVFSLQEEEDSPYPSMADLQVLDNLPLPSILIKYLKYFRDPNQQRPIYPNRVEAGNFSSEVDSDDSIDAFLGGRDNDGGQGRGRRIRYHLVLR